MIKLLIVSAFILIAGCESQEELNERIGRDIASNIPEEAKLIQVHTYGWIEFSFRGRCYLYKSLNRTSAALAEVNCGQARN